MSTTLTDQIFAALAEFSSASRLYELRIGDCEETGLLVEAFLAQDGVQEVGTRDVIALSTDAYLGLDSLLGQPATLEICLADGSRERFGGEVCEAAMLGSDGGLARYRVRMSCWLWRLGQVRNCRVWQDKSVIEIVDDVFEACQPLARWRWSQDASFFLQEVSPRSYCCQYRESDLDFISRLLAEEGLCWRTEQTEDGPGAVLFADSSQLSAVPQDPSSEAQGGIRFHGARSVEESDSIQALSAQRRLHASLTTVLSYDYKAKQAVAASSPSHYTYGKLPVLESFEVPGQYAYADWQQAQHYADLRMQEQEARGQMWHGRSTVRTLRAGTRMQVLGAPLQQLSESASFTVLRVFSIGVNNMPPTAQHALAELFGPIPELLEDLTRKDMPEDLGLAIAQARETGYANWFSAVASEIIWRPSFEVSSGRSYRKPVALGAQSAIVVGADGNDQASGADELYCDSLGRIRIRFHWQDVGNTTCWVRVAQRSAGGGMGQQFLPRIGQEVLVQFLENDIDRPIIVGALYNGQGEGGIVATPGGRRDSEADSDCFKTAHDHATSAQGNLSGGHSPVWHGASPGSDGHRNITALWGFRSKEIGGYGASQLLFDETAGQGRTQLKSSNTGSELNFGHLIHASDNYRGGLRGSGAELRTNSYGATRAGAGLLVSSCRMYQNTTNRDLAAENAVGIKNLMQGTVLAGTSNSAAKIHQTVCLTAQVGTTKAIKSVINPSAAPLAAMLKTLHGSGVTPNRNERHENTSASSAGNERSGCALPSSPIIEISSTSFFSMNATDSLQLTSGESTVLMTSQDGLLVCGAHMRIQPKQVIGLLGGEMKGQDANLGLQLMAVKDAVSVESQADEVRVNARDDLLVASATTNVDLAARKKIILSVSSGASITIGEGNVKFSCPGVLKIYAGKKNFAAAAKMVYPFPAMPESFCYECLVKARNSGAPFILMHK